MLDGVLDIHIITDTRALTALRKMLQRLAIGDKR
ncbi:MAG: hypothetical protein ACJAWQ_001631 [Paraglaciecola sp.]|jgi:hypothetical protein